MKIKVVGWTCYDWYDFDSGENSWPAHMAVVDEIKRNGYLFSGEDHQERTNCCPVFNDGKMRRFSQRGFANMMAEAHGDHGVMDYAMYMFGIKLSACKFPKNTTHPNDFVPETNLSETFTMVVDEQFFDSSPMVETKTLFGFSSTKTVIKLPDLDSLRYIGEGDTLVLTCGNKTATFEIIDVERGRDLTEDEHVDYMSRMHYAKDENQRKLAQQEFVALPVVITLTVKQK